MQTAVSAVPSSVPSWLRCAHSTERRFSNSTRLLAIGAPPATTVLDEESISRNGSPIAAVAVAMGRHSQRMPPAPCVARSVFEFVASNQETIDRSSARTRHDVIDDTLISQTYRESGLTGLPTNSTDPPECARS